MNHNEAPPMANYPSPPPPTHNGFYSGANVSPQDSRQPDPEGLQLAAQLSGSLAEPLINQNEADAQLAGQLDGSQNHEYEGQQGQQYEGQQTSQYENQQTRLQYEGLEVPSQRDHPMAHAGMDQVQGGQAYGTPDTPSGEPKKRSKVSRACDECRRKKIRCDAFSEQENCSNCKRVGARCQFSRVPQKRGPSKGYIKELSDRVNNLEASARHSLHPNEVPYPPLNPEGASPSGFDEFSPGPNGGLARKRNHSAISGDFGGSPYQAFRPPMDWQSANNQRQQHPSSSGYQSGQPGAGSIVDAGYPAYTSDGMASQPTWRDAPDGAKRISVSVEPTSQNGHIQADHQLDWTSSLERYYAVLHPMLPLLPTSPAKFLARISRANCPVLVEDALYETIQSVNTCLLGEDVAPRVESVNRSARDAAIMSRPPDAPGSRNMATNLLYLQVMLFRVIEADNMGPSQLHHGGIWLGLAVNYASVMQLHIPPEQDNTGEFDPDSDEWLARRLWWCLVVLDRWHAVSTSSLVKIPDSGVQFLHVDKVALGECAYQLARLSMVQGHVAHYSMLLRKPDHAASFAVPTSASVVSDILNGELDRCRESLDITDYNVFPNMFHILFLHILHLRLLIRRINPATESQDIRDTANEVAEILRHKNPITPFKHHFAAVAAFSLLYLRSIKKIDDNHLGLQWLTESTAGRNVSNEGKDWYSAMMKIIVEGAGGSASSPLTSRSGQDGSASGQGASLQHLADLATAEGENQQSSNAATALANQLQTAAAEGDAETGKDGETTATPKIWDQSELMKKGYMCVLASYSSK